jgi:DNA-binding transcriptional ArsR family regulator
MREAAPGPEESIYPRRFDLLIVPPLGHNLLLSYAQTRLAHDLGLTINKRTLIELLVLDEDRVFRALADPSRRAIFERLTRGEAAVRDLTPRFNISQPAVSQHLAVLRDAGLVSERREGRLAYYRVEPKGLRPLVDWIAHYQAFWVDRIGRLQQLLKEMDE